MTILTLPRPVLAATGRDDNLDCIICDCRPHISFCGRYYPSDPKPDEITRDNTCPECYEIWLQDPPCPNCGCRIGDMCQLCEVNL